MNKLKKKSPIISKFISKEITEVYEKYRKLTKLEVKRVEDLIRALEADEVYFYDPYEKKLIGITAMTKLLGKEKFDELLSDLLEKPRGKTTLVPDTDKRQEIENIKDEFQKEEM